MAAEGDADDDGNPPQPAPTEDASIAVESQRDNGDGVEEQAQPQGDNFSGARQRPDRTQRSRTKESNTSGTRPENPNPRAVNTRRNDRTGTRTPGRDSGGRARPAGNRRDDSRPGAGPAETGASNKSSRDLGAFKLIADRNIFNSTRSARVSRAGSEPSRRSNPETLTLVGTMSYEKGVYAFFDGSKSDYRRVLEIGKSIANHKLVAVSADAVTLQVSTNTFELRIGGQLRKGEDRWEAVAGSAPTRETSSATPSATPAAPGDEDEVVRRLMQQREQELK
jgi:hypothetical protein